VKKNAHKIFQSENISKKLLQPLKKNKIIIKLNQKIVYNQYRSKKWRY